MFRRREEPGRTSSGERAARAVVPWQEAAFKLVVFEPGVKIRSSNGLLLRGLG